MKSCNISVDNQGRTMLHADNGVTQVSRILSNVELGKLNAVLTDNSLSDESKCMKIGGMVNGIVLSKQVSENFENSMRETQQQRVISR